MRIIDPRLTLDFPQEEVKLEITLEELTIIALLIGADNTVELAKKLKDNIRINPKYKSHLNKLITNSNLVEKMYAEMDKYLESKNIHA